MTWVSVLYVRSESSAHQTLRFVMVALTQACSQLLSGHRTHSVGPQSAGKVSCARSSRPLTSAAAARTPYCSASPLPLRDPSNQQGLG